ncbi:unnamed protein product [Schistocephalus solidus]|uniref:Uncharacterized protein n=1 Tax=Schistocephalus solidus TaxID=70667 RepID=A0A3P7C7L4_SCHSO|nr:unnamed protein product [Schistocephalus solidus]
MDASPAFWFSIPLTVVLALLVDIIWRLASDIWWDHQIELSGVKREKAKKKRRVRRKMFRTSSEDFEETARKSPDVVSSYHVNHVRDYPLTNRMYLADSLKPLIGRVN